MKSPAPFYLFLIVLLCLFINTSEAQSIGINTDGSSPDPSAMLHVKNPAGTGKGFLMPRMSSALRAGISSPADGLQVYDTDTKNFWLYKTGIGWTEMTATNYWTQSGNNIYNNNSGNTGVGLSNPRSKLHVNGTSWFQGDNTPLPSGAGSGIAIGSTASLNYIYSYDYAANTNENLYLQHPGGNVGIGISTAPSARLHVANSSTHAIYGISASAIGVYGVSSSSGSTGVYGTSAYIGVEGVCTGTDANRHAIRGENNTGTAGGYAAIFVGTTWVSGTLIKSGGSFMIDHPLDPENKFLSHSFVESPDMKNIYDGVTTTGAEGKVTVSLPGWFQALNKDFRYQLTVMGQFAQAIVAEEISNNQFVIQTDKPSVKVSWQVTGIRKDAYAEQNRIPVESFKNKADRGKYIYPQGFNKPADQKISALKFEVD